MGCSLGKRTRYSKRHAPGPRGAFQPPDRQAVDLYNIFLRVKRRGSNQMKSAKQFKHPAQ